ncbi:MAG: hypothetical protein WBS19_14985 [Candidatus Korobacteraceae bacterium]
MSTIATCSDRKILWAVLIFLVVPVMLDVVLVPPAEAGSAIYQGLFPRAYAHG